MDALAYFNMQNSSRVVTDLKAAGINVYGDTRLVLGNHYYNNAINTGSYEDLGKGLHGIQDIFAHGNTGVKDIDKEGFDATLAEEGIASHQFRDGAKHIDDPDYDWADCALTKVVKVGSANSERYRDTELASKAYLASGNYEMTH